MFVFVPKTHFDKFARWVLLTNVRDVIFFLGQKVVKVLF